MNEKKLLELIKEACYQTTDNRIIFENYHKFAGFLDTLSGWGCIGLTFKGQNAIVKLKTDTIPDYCTPRQTKRKRNYVIAQEKIDFVLKKILYMDENTITEMKNTLGDHTYKKALIQMKEQGTIEQSDCKVYRAIWDSYEQVYHLQFRSKWFKTFCKLKHAEWETIKNRLGTHEALITLYKKSRGGKKNGD